MTSDTTRAQFAGLDGKWSAVRALTYKGANIYGAPVNSSSDKRPS